jgi:hypothetical protein
MPSALAQGAEDGLGAAADRAVRQDEMDGLLEVGQGDFGELGGDGWVLEGEIIDRAGGGEFPAGDPTAAELAIAVKDQQGPGRGRLNSVDFWHGFRLSL